ncbi:MAG: hypothetical protein WA996_23465 [Candidatus Promineifilaceae bacterium]
MGSRLIRAVRRGIDPERRHLPARPAKILFEMIYEDPALAHRISDLVDASFYRLLVYV